MTAPSNQTHGYGNAAVGVTGIDVRQKLSPHFRLSEFTRSRTAKTYQLYNVPREEAEVANLRALAVNALEPARALLGSYVIITSGFRCPTVNRLVGGSANSQHMLGEAADIVVRGVQCFDAATTIAASDIPFDQLIYEARLRDGAVSEWLHISHRRLGGNRRQTLTIVKSDGERTVQTGIQPLPDTSMPEGNSDVA